MGSTQTGGGGTDQGITSEEKPTSRDTWTFGGDTYTGCEVAARLMHASLTSREASIAAQLVSSNSGFDADAWLSEVESWCDAGGLKEFDDVRALRWFSTNGVTQATRRLARMGVA